MLVPKTTKQAYLHQNNLNMNGYESRVTSHSPKQLPSHVSQRSHNPFLSRSVLVSPEDASPTDMAAIRDNKSTLIVNLMEDQREKLIESGRRQLYLGKSVGFAVGKKNPLVSALAAHNKLDLS